MSESAMLLAAFKIEMSHFPLKNLFLFQKQKGINVNTDQKFHNKKVCHWGSNTAVVL